MFLAVFVPVAISNFTSGGFCAASYIAFWKPNDVAKMILLPSRIRLSITCAVCGPSGTFSLNVVSTFDQSCFWTYWRPLSCACDHPPSLCGPTKIQAALIVACDFASPGAVATASATASAPTTASAAASASFLFDIPLLLENGQRGVPRDYTTPIGL